MTTTGTDPRPETVLDFTGDPTGAANFLAGYLANKPADIRNALVVLTEAALGEVPFASVAAWENILDREFQQFIGSKTRLTREWPEGEPAP